MSNENYRTIPITQLVKAPWNYKLDDVELKEKLKANITRNGQIENIVVRLMPDGMYEIVNGNHRFDALIELNIAEVMCYDLGTISDAKAKRIAIELNETRFGSDHLRLAETVVSLKEEFSFEELETSLPFSMEDLTEFEKVIQWDWSQYAKDNPPAPDGAGRRLIIDMPEELATRWMEWKDKCQASNDVEALTRALDALDNPPPEITSQA